MENTLNDLRILIVDDHHIIRRTLHQWLSGKYPGMELISASSGEEAVSTACETPVDLILMDVHLPGIDGIETTRKIKAAQPEIRIIILTVQEVDRYRQTALEAGADGYVIKRKMYTDLIPTIATFYESSENVGG